MEAPGLIAQLDLFAPCRCGAPADFMGEDVAVCRSCVARVIADVDAEAAAIARRLVTYTHDCPAGGCLVCILAGVA